MFGMGIMELAVVLAVALLVLGPKQLPEAARTLGRWFYQIKNTADSARQEMEKDWVSNPDVGSDLHHPTEKPTRAKDHAP